MHNIGIMISFIRNFTMQVKMFELFLLHELGTLTQREFVFPLVGRYKTDKILMRNTKW